MPRHRKVKARRWHVPRPASAVVSALARPRARAIRGLLITPWLAAGAGLVVAAALSLSTPRAVLSYGPRHPPATCDRRACGTASARRLPGGAERGSPRTDLAHARSVEASKPAATQAGPLESVRGGPVVVRYRTVRRSPAGFTGLITITGHASLGDWRLAFRYPGAVITSVAGASWQARGDGGVARARRPASGPPAGRVARILFVATGRPGWPDSCRLDGLRCAFR
ncbi:MAG: hypothetical protein ABSA03_18780 [Streptosporangiaceae bacterium]|jgi:hypothetical protein